MMQSRSSCIQWDVFMPVVWRSSLFLDVRFLQSVFLPFVGGVEQEGRDECRCAEQGEDGHRTGVGRVGLVDASYQHADSHQTDVLYEENHAIGCSEAPQWNDFGH